MNMHVKKGDKVKVITGGDKGKEGVILRVLLTTGKVVVEGVKIAKRNLKATKTGQKGQIVEVAMPIDASNVKKI